jgi:hypothetical protein
MKNAQQTVSGHDLESPCVNQARYSFSGWEDYGQATQQAERTNR